MVIEPPDTATTLVLRTVDGGPPELTVMGPSTRAGYFVPAPGVSCRKLRLRPGQALEGRSARDLVDQVMPLGEDPRLTGNELVFEAAQTLSRGESVRSTALALNVSERHLRSLFTRSVGLSPKQFVRIDRVRAVLAGARERSWAQLAAELGYYDQSHLTAEFREVMGVPPGAFFAGRLPEPSGCARTWTSGS
ncbi:helix-turn-helix domain-containing protein [Amycolatopsis sp. NPDC059657]|uniref:helix-turn-helix domain-containing protein n=1 Tax=Amycolatopsis sp. NPDC059657 TaxID=3346899 RepID=UPI0036721AD0